jgi:hypothetical protein
MMAALVVLRIEHDKDAREFVDEMKKLNPTEVVGLFKAPTAFCETNGHCSSPEEFIWLEPYNWVGCGGCGKPTRTWGENIRAVIGTTKNYEGPNETAMVVSKAFNPRDVVAIRKALFEEGTDGSVG